jgi:hypothetical protein
MAHWTPTANKSNIRVQWMWNAGANPFSKSDSIEWKRYSDGENIIIEDAFQAGQKYAVLDNYSIDFEQKIQILNTNSDKQRPVRRMLWNKDEHHPREERFTFTAINPKRPFAGAYGWISPFIRDVAKDLRITPNQLPSKDKTILPMILEKAARGIIEEGKKTGKQREAEQFAKMLREKKNERYEKIWECCAYLYSLESFLYQKLNETMRLIGSEGYRQHWQNKVRTLGPFCLLLWDTPPNYNSGQKGMLLYRGANLSLEQISSFADDCLKNEKPLRSFPSFTSCTRNLEVAKSFGNTLFIMKVKYAFTVDIAPFAEFPNEEEELLAPSVCFTVHRVEKHGNKHWIYLELMQQHRRK